MMGLYVTMPSDRRSFFTADTFYFPEGLEQRIAKSKLMQLLVREGPEAQVSIKQVYELMCTEPDLEIVGSHDYRLPGRYDLAPKYYT